MAYIEVIGENDAEGELWKVYDEIQRTRGRVSNVLRIQSLDPRGLKTHLDMYMALLFGKGPLPRRQREMIAVVVSVANGCEYCYIHHGEAFNKYAKDEGLLKELIANPEGVPLEGQDKALCDYARHLTLEPATGRKDAVEKLRSAGFDDAAILHATEIAAYFNFVNRIVHGLGVELEDDADRDYDY